MRGIRRGCGGRQSLCYVDGKQLEGWEMHSFAWGEGLGRLVRREWGWTPVLRWAEKVLYIFLLWLLYDFLYLKNER